MGRDSWISSRKEGRMLWILIALVISISSTTEPVNDYWWTLRDGHVTFCAEGGDAGWVERTIEEGWGIDATFECSKPDLIVELLPNVYASGYGEVCAIMHLFSNPCLVQISSVCLACGSEYSTRVLAHEFGHCAGFDHRETGVMTQPPTSMPTEEDKRLMRVRYGLYLKEG